MNQDNKASWKKKKNLEQLSAITIWKKQILLIWAIAADFQEHVEESVYVWFAPWWPTPALATFRGQQEHTLVSGKLKHGRYMSL